MLGKSLVSASLRLRHFLRHFVDVRHFEVTHAIHEVTQCAADLRHVLRHFGTRLLPLPATSEPRLFALGTSHRRVLEGLIDEAVGLAGTRLFAVVVVGEVADVADAFVG